MTKAIPYSFYHSKRSQSLLPYNPSFFDIVDIKILGGMGGEQAKFLEERKSKGGRTLQLVILVQVNLMNNVLQSRTIN